MLSILFSFRAASSILLRRLSGSDYVGITALLSIWTGTTILAIVLLFARGFLHGTAVGRLIDVPVVSPALFLAAFVTLIWTLRSFGRLRFLGQLKSRDADAGFTGHAAPFWFGLRMRTEWTALEFLEPALYLVAAAALLLLEPTRAIGMYLLLLALFVCESSSGEKNGRSDWAFVLPHRIIPPPLAQQIAALAPADAKLLDFPPPESTPGSDAQHQAPDTAPASGRGVPQLRVELGTNLKMDYLSMTLLLVIGVLAANFALDDLVGLKGLWDDRFDQAVNSTRSGYERIAELGRSVYSDPLAIPGLLFSDEDWHIKTETEIPATVETGASDTGE